MYFTNEDGKHVAVKFTRHPELLSNAGLGAASPAACPAGYGSSTFNDGLQSALKGLPVSILSGLTFLPSIGQANAGNVVLPDGVTPCYQANRNSPAFVIGMALPGLIVVAAVAYFVFGKGGR